MLYRDGEHAQDATGNAATELRLAHASAATAAAGNSSVGRRCCEVEGAGDGAHLLLRLQARSARAGATKPQLLAAATATPTRSHAQRARTLQVHVRRVRSVKNRIRHKTAD